MPRLSIALGLSIALLAAGCDQRGQAREDPGSSHATVEAPPRREVFRRPLVTLANATSARLFVHVGDSNDPNKEYLEPEGRRLSQAQRTALEDALTVVGYDRPPFEATACFVPHHFVRYYDETGRQIGQIDICFCCEAVAADRAMFGPVPTGIGDVQVEFGAKLRSVIEGMGLPTNVQSD